MKKIIYSLFVLMAVAGFSSCERDTNYQWLDLDPQFPNPMTVKASVDSLVLDKEKGDETALTFTWTKGNDRGPGTSLRYLVKMDLAGNGFDEAIDAIEMPDGQFSISFTHDFINDTIMEKWKAIHDYPTELSFRVIAQVQGGEQFQKPEIAETSVKVVPFELLPIPHYLVGDAIQGGVWDYDDPVMMVQERRKYIYTYKGHFDVGQFKIITDTSLVLPSFNPVDPTQIEGELYKRTDDSEPDILFEVTEAGEYELRIDIVNMTYILAPPAPKTLYLSGDASPGGYNMSDFPILKWNYNEPTKWVYEGELIGGKKFHCLVDIELHGMSWDNSPYIQPSTENQPIKPGETSTFIQKNGKDNNARWVLDGDSGNYRLTFDLGTNILTVEKL